MRQTVEVKVDGKLMPTLLWQHEGAGRRPGVVVAQHIPVAHAGLERDPFQLDVGERLARAGYAVVMPWLFHHWPAEDSLPAKRDAFRDDWCQADLAAAHDLLAGCAGVDPARIAIVGHCWGGRIAFLTAASDARYRAAVVFYGGRIKLPMADNGPPPISLAGRIGCPMLGIFGNDDGNPSPADVDDIERALKEAGVAHEFHRYDGAGHGFQDFTDAERYRKTQAADAWGKLLAFLECELG